MSWLFTLNYTFRSLCRCLHLCLSVSLALCLSPSLSLVSLSLSLSVFKSLCLSCSRSLSVSHFLPLLNCSSDLYVIIDPAPASPFGGLHYSPTHPLLSLLLLFVSLSLFQPPHPTPISRCSDGKYTCCYLSVIEALFIIIDICNVGRMGKCINISVSNCILDSLCWRGV